MTAPHREASDDPGRRGGYRVPLARPKPPAATPSEPGPPTGPSGWSLTGWLAILAALGLYGVGEWFWSEHIGAGIIAAPILLTITLFALRTPIAKERSFDLGGLVLTSLGLRLLIIVPRFFSATDANVYNHESARLAVSFRQLNFTSVDVGGGASVPGTGSLRYIAGLVQVLTGSNFFASTLIFGFLAFWGCWFLYRAFVIALPDADRQRYARLLFLWPSLLYWPSSMGKDSWMVFTGGIVALGAARLLTRNRGGYLLLAVGLVLGALVRPHVSLLLFAAVAVAFIIGRRDERRIPGQISLGAVTKAIGIVVLLVAGSLLAPATARFLKVDELSTDSLSTTIENTQERTSGGNSAFTPADPNSLIGYPIAVVTVIFRPLPTEVPGVSGLASGVEGLLLLGIVVTSWRRLWTALRQLRRWPYVTLAASFVAMFAYAFAALANFGILSRERVMMLPMLFVLLSLPPARRTDDPSPGPADRPAATSVSTRSGFGLRRP